MTSIVGAVRKYYIFIIIMHASNICAFGGDWQAVDKKKNVLRSDAAREVVNSPLLLTVYF